MNKRTMIRNICFVLAVLLTVAMLVKTVNHAKDMWENEGKSYNFDSFFEYFVSVQKGAVLISLMSGVAVALLGVVVQKHKNRRLQQ